MPRGPDAQTDRLRALRLQPPHHRTNFSRASFSHDIEDVVQVRLGRGRRTGCDVRGAQRRGISQFIERQFLDGLTEIAGIEIARERCEIGHDRSRHIPQTGADKRCFDLFSTGGIIIDSNGIGIGMTLKRLANPRCRLERASGHNDLGIPRLPVAECRQNGVGGRVICVLDKGRARTGEKPLRLDRIHQRGGVLAQIARGHPAQAHFFIGCGAKQRCQQFLTPERHPHRISTIDQNARALRLWLGKVADSIARRELHSGLGRSAARRRINS